VVILTGFYEIIQKNHLGDYMKNIGLFEAKQKLSELVERASSGERIGITRRGKLAAFLVPARKRRRSERSLYQDRTNS
jgi:prevent-host-death family protein